MRRLMSIYLWIILKETVLTGLSLIYLRFIDGIFFLWTGSKETLIWNLDELNRKHDSMKFEHKISKTSICFVENELCIKNNKLYTKIYRKQTDRQSFLHTDLEHKNWKTVFHTVKHYKLNEFVQDQETF